MTKDDDLLEIANRNVTIINDVLSRGTSTYSFNRKQMPATSLDTDGVKIGKLSRALTKATRALTQNDSWTVYVRRNTVRSAARCVLVKGANKIDIEVFLDQEKYPADSFRFIEEVLCLYYHELSHAWWSPNYSVRSKHRGWFVAANILEDKRIETFSVACFPNLAGFFRRGFNRMIMTADNDSEVKEDAKLRTSYLIAAGRRYLDPKLVQRLKDVFICPELISDIDQLTEEYKLFKAGQLRKGEHVDIVNDFEAICNKVWSATKQAEPDIGDHEIAIYFPSPHEHGSQPDQGMPNSKEEKEAIQLIESEDADTYDNTNGVPREDDDSDEGQQDGPDMDGGAADAAAADESDSNSAGQGDADDADSNSDSEQSGDGTDGQSSDDDGLAGTSGTATGESDQGNDTDSDQDTDNNGAGTGARSDSNGGDDLRELLDAVLDELDISNELEAMSNDTADEIRNYRETMRGDTKIEQLNGAPMYPATPEMEHIANEFAREMGLLIAPDVDPGWDRGQPVGRINVGRYFRGDAFDTVFDRWAPGHNDAFALRAGIMIDSSSSMSGDPIDEASKAGWCIRRALEKHEAEVRTISWAYANDYDYIGGDEPVGREYTAITASGGTFPMLPLIDINMWMEAAQPNVNKLLFILTDGEWSSTVLCNNELAHLRSHRTHVVLVGFDCDVLNPAWSDGPVTEYDQAFNIKNPMELVDIAKSVVLEMYQKIGHQVKMGGRY